MIRLVGGRILDPASGRDEIGDVLIDNNRLIDKAMPNGETVIDVSGYVVAPGFVDLHCHLREPGFEDTETIATGTAAAASIGLINSFGNLGGFAGPYVVGYLSKRTNSYAGGVLYLSLSALVAAGLVLSLRATRRKRSLA